MSPQFSESQACTSSHSNEPCIRLQHISMSYDGATPTLNDISLEFYPGERVCVLGANGSGKSSLALICAGLLAPDAGELELMGKIVFSDTREERLDYEAYKEARRSLGLVFQNPDDQIVTSIVEDDVAFGPENLQLAQEEIASRVHEELQRVAMLDFAQADPSRLSGGQKQRVCLASACALHPQVLILDEPAALLDVRGRRELLKLMKQLSREGRCLIHITHFMSDVKDADRVIVLDRGRIVCDTKPQDLFQDHATILTKLGLSIPAAGRLADHLIDHGLPITWTYDEDELVNSLAQVLHKRVATTSIKKISARTQNKSLAIGSDLKELNPDTCSDIQNKSPVPIGAPCITAQKLSFSYRQQKRALHDLAFEIPEHRHTVIVGHTGSGKSTLLRLISGLEQADAGTLTVFGYNMSHKKQQRAAQNSIGFVMQQPERQLFAPTVEEELAFGPRHLGLSSHEVKERVDQILEIIDLEHKRDVSPFSLSGGQKRLVALGSILTMRPRLVLLDEPTAGLDPQGRFMLRQLLKRLPSYGATLIQVSHSMEDAARADHVIVLDRSHIVMSGTPKEVFQSKHEALLSNIGLGLPRYLRIAKKLTQQGCNMGEPLTRDTFCHQLNRLWEVS